MFELKKIEELIKNEYPSMPDLFADNFSDIELQQIIKQLQWVTNERELNRTLHRLHCFLQCLEEHDDYSSIKVLTKLTPTEKQALLALFLIDGCKCSAPAIEAFEKKQHKSPKDSVEFFFYTLQKQPDIYPIFNVISNEAQKHIAENIFYLHQRHLMFGEVPSSSLHDFAKLFENEKPDKLRQRLRLLNQFWLINLLGFDEPKCAEKAKREDLGPTMPKERLAQILKVQSHLDKCIEKKSLQPLENFYSSQNTLPVVGRIRMLLLDKFKNKANSIIKELIKNNFGDLKKLAETETHSYKKYHLLAITFLPAVFWKLVELNQNKSHKDIALIFIKFQIAFYQALPDIIEKLKGNRSIPLFSISKNEDFLKEFSLHPNDPLKLSVTIDKYMTINAQLAPKNIETEKESPSPGPKK